MTGLPTDLRYGLRYLLADPGFTLVAVATLALGIGANVGIFTVIDAILLRPLPYAQPERLVALYQAYPERGVDRGGVSRPDFEDWRDAATTLASLAVHWTTPDGMVLVDGGEPQELQTTYVAGDFFGVLGVPAQVGRTPNVDDERGDDHVVVLSDGLWRRRFGADPEIVGRRLTLDHRPFTVLGVMPRDFRFPHSDTELWTFASVIPASSIPFHLRPVRLFEAIGRLAPAATPARVEAELSQVAAALAAEYPDDSAGATAVRALPLAEEMVAPVRTAMLVLLAAAGLVLAIACANVANLLLARGVGRRRELAVRAALGAGRGRLVRQLLTESLLLAALGGLFGLAFGAWGVDLLLALGGDYLPRATEVAFDRRVLLAALAATAATGLFFGLLPALRAARLDLTGDLQQGGRGGDLGATGGWRRGLAVAEITLALVLVIGAGLLLNSFWRLARVDPGFDAERLLAVSLTVPDSKYPERPAYLAVHRELLARVAALPGVERVASIKSVPLVGRAERAVFTVAGRPEPDAAETPVATLHQVSPGLFATLGVPLFAGRDFDAGDGAEAEPVVIVSRTLAARYWSRHEEAVGQQMVVGGTERTVIGVVDDIRVRDLGEAPEPTVYLAQAQNPRRVLTLMVRTAGPAEGMLVAVREVIRSVDAQQPITTAAPMPTLIARSLGRPRFLTTLLIVLGAVALALAAIGTYGVVAYAVRARRAEIGIRIALGADRQAVVRMVLREGLVIAALGIAIGIAGALVLTRLLGDLLYAIGPRDLATYAAASLVLLGAAALACYLPAQRAARVDPIETLR